MPAVNIAVVGAGSAQFSLGVVKDLASIPGLYGSHVRFMDISQERLNTTHAIAERYTREAGADVKFTKTLDREEALDGADFVLNCALVGGWRGRRGLRDLAAKYTDGGTKRMSMGALGSFRQFDLFAGVVRDMHRLCPHAWYIQSSNPMVSGITLVNRVAPVKSVGLCHGIGAIPGISKTIGLDPAKITFQTYGLNHFIWLTHYRHDGVDAYPVLDRWIENEADAFWKTKACSPSNSLGPKAVKMYQMLGLFPIGDTCTPGGGNWPNWFRLTPEMAAKWNEDGGAWIERHIVNMEGRMDVFQKALSDKGAPLTQAFPGTRTGEANITIIDALANDKGGIFQVNVPNKGAIPGIPDDIAAEFPAYVSGAGIQRLQFDPLPEPIMHFVHERVQRTRNDVETYLSRSRDRLVLSILGESDIGWDVANAFLDEVFADEANKDMAAHFE